MNYKHLGQNIQTVRKLKGMKQQELADAIGINLQSLSKIERGVNYPTFETLEKIMAVLEVAPNEMLSGTWKFEPVSYLKCAPDPLSWCHKQSPII